MKLVDVFDFNNNEAKNIILDKLSAAPGTTNVGQVYYNTSDTHFYGNSGGTFKQLDVVNIDILSNSSTVGILNKLVGSFSTGEILYWNAGKIDSMAASSFVPSSRTVAISGDVTASALALSSNISLSATVTAIQNKTITLATGYLKYNGTAFVFDNSTFLTAAVTSVNGMTGPAITIAVNATNLTVANATNTVTLNTIQNISTTSSPTFAGMTISGNITINGSPSVSTDAVTKGYVDNLIVGLRDYKESVKVATTGVITLSAPQTIDGVSVVAGDRVLVKDQSTQLQNGIYVVAAGAWSRASDFVAGTSSNVTLGVYLYVESGTVNNGSGFVLASSNAASPSTSINVGTDTVVFTKFSGGSVYSFGLGLYTLGTTITVGNYTLNGLLIGAGAGASATILSPGSQYNVLVGGASGVPTWGTVNLASASAVGTSILPVANGGTNIASYAVGDLLYASGATTLAKLADIATGNALISGGVGVAPSWGKIGLTTHISGTLGIGNGGTGVTGTPTNGQLLIGNGSGYTIASVTQGSGIIITPGAGSLTFAIDSATVIREFSTTWVIGGTLGTSGATSTTATSICGLGYYVYAVVHSLSSAEVSVTVIDTSNGEPLMCEWYAATVTTFNQATPAYGNTSTIVIKMSSAGLSSILGKTVKIIVGA